MNKTKCTVTEDDSTNLREYPYFGVQTRGISIGAIVLFTALGTGIVVASAECRPIGEQSEDWDELGAFKPFYGKIVIEVTK